MKASLQVQGLQTDGEAKSSVLRGEVSPAHRLRANSQRKSLLSLPTSSLPRSSVTETHPGVCGAHALPGCSLVPRTRRQRGTRLRPLISPAGSLPTTPCCFSWLLRLAGATIAGLLQINRRNG